MSDRVQVQQSSKYLQIGQVPKSEKDSIDWVKIKSLINNNLRNDYKFLNRKFLEKEHNSFEGHGDWVKSVCFSPDQKLILSGSKDGTIKLWDIFTKQCLETFKHGDACVNSVCFSPDQKLILSGSIDGTIKLWDFQKKECLETFKHGDACVNSVCFSPDSKLILSGSDDGTIKLWQYQGLKNSTDNFLNQLDQIKNLQKDQTISYDYLNILHDYQYNLLHCLLKYEDNILSNELFNKLLEDKSLLPKIHICASKNVVKELKLDQLPDLLVRSFLQYGLKSNKGEKFCKLCYEQLVCNEQILNFKLLNNELLDEHVIPIQIQLSQINDKQPYYLIKNLQNFENLSPSQQEQLIQLQVNEIDEKQFHIFPAKKQKIDDSKQQYYFYQINSKNLLKLLDNINNNDTYLDSDDLFKSTVLKYITEYYYNNYARPKFYLEFLISQICLILFVIYLTFYQSSIFMENYNVNDQDPIFIQNYKNIALSCFVFVVFEVLIELTEIITNKIGYFTQYQNIFQLVHITLKILFIHNDQISLKNSRNQKDINDNQIIALTALIFNIYSSIQYWTIYDTFLNIHIMMKKTIQELGSFLLYLLLLIVSGFLILYQVDIIGVYNNLDGEQDIARSKFRMYISTMMILFGQYDDIFFINSELQQGNNETNTWNIILLIIFIIVLVFLQLVLMNLLIAIVGEKYGEVISNKDKVKLYHRIELTVSHINKYYPKLQEQDQDYHFYIVSQSEKIFINQEEGANELEGVQDSLQVLQDKFESRQDKLEEKFESRQDKLEEKFQNLMDHHQVKLEEKFQNLMDKQEEKFASRQDKLENLLHSLLEEIRQKRRNE